MDRETAVKLYKKMVQIRKFEEKLYHLFLTRIMPGSMHQYNGQEAVAAGVCAHLTNDDYITSTHRGHGHCIAKGVSLKAIMAEMFAKKTGCCKGMGGSMHIADFSVGMLGAIAIVGAGIPIATGAGWSCQHRGKEGVAVSFFGDGAVNGGAFHEGINLAAVWKLPVIFVCENNLYGFSTHYRRVTSIDNIADRASSYGIPGVVVDGMDVLSVYNEAGKAVERARKGGGPTLMECKTYRFKGHSRFEKSTYRSQQELAEWKKRDPITLFKQYLIHDFKVDEQEILQTDKEVESEVEEAVAYAERSPDPGPEDYKKYIYA